MTNEDAILAGGSTVMYMTIRDAMACAALTGLLVDPHKEETMLSILADEAYRLADAMLVERAKERG